MAQGESDLFETPDAGAPAEVFATRLVAATLGATEIFAVHMGRTLGWYDALVEHGPLTSAGLAERTGTHERYVREWLEQQASCGYLLVDASAEAAARRFSLAPGAVPALTDPDSPLFTSPVAGIVVAAGRRIDDLVTAYRDGGGVSWEQLGPDARDAQAGFNRPMFLHELTPLLEQHLPDLRERLVGPARVADIGCGEGWSSIGLARGFPAASFVGFDIDEPSIVAARQNAAELSLQERLSFVATDGAALASSYADAFDVVMAFECVHDMPDPVGVLAAVRSMVRDDGYVLVMDERAADAFEAPSDPIERLLYGFSLMCCLPDGLSTPGSVGTGTVMRPDVLAGYALAAGFSHLEVLPVEHELFRFYRLHL